MPKTPLNEYLLLSRGRWDAGKSAEQIQSAIDDFHAWYDRMICEGRFKPGRRLATEARLVTRVRAG